jgi:hypothetical protein
MDGMASVATGRPITTRPCRTYPGWRRPDGCSGTTGFVETIVYPDCPYTQSDFSPSAAMRGTAMRGDARLLRNDRKLVILLSETGNPIVSEIVPA